MHSVKQTLEKQMIVNMSSLCKMVDQNEIQILWTKKEKQISADVLTKAGAQKKLLLQTLESSKMLDL